MFSPDLITSVRLFQPGSRFPARWQAVWIVWDIEPTQEDIFLCMNEKNIYLKSSNRVVASIVDEIDATRHLSSNYMKSAVTPSCL